MPPSDDSLTRFLLERADVRGAFVRADSQFRNWVTPDGSAGFNPGFDVTPARLVTGLITERGVAAATEAGLRGLYGHG